MISIKQEKRKIFKPMLAIAAMLAASHVNADCDTECMSESLKRAAIAMQSMKECKIGQECWSEKLAAFVAPACKAAIERSLNPSPYHSYRWSETSEDAIEFKVLTVTNGNRFLFVGDAIKIKSTSSDLYGNDKERENGRFFYMGDKGAIGDFFQHSYACGITMGQKTDGGHVNLSFNPSKVDIMIQPGDVK